MGSTLLLIVVIVTALAFDFTNGFHDTANAMATSMATRALRPREHASTPVWVIIACAVTIGAGTYVGGWRIIRTLGHRLTHVEPPQGFAAETSGASVLLAFDRADRAGACRRRPGRDPVLDRAAQPRHPGRRMSTFAAEVVKWSALGKEALIAGVGVVGAYGLVVIGASRYRAARRAEGRGGSAAAASVSLAVIGGGVCVAAVVFGIIAIVHKP